MRWNLPNILTVIRLIAAVLFVAVYLVLPRPYADWTGVSLFITAALTDYFDGLLARKWGQVSNFGKMLDPIADKAMTMLALMMLLILYFRDGRTIYFPLESPWIVGDWILVVPVMVIVFREVFISGLREFLGGKSANLAVTNLAKWKTTVQMVAVAALLIVLLFEHYLVVLSFAMDEASLRAILAGDLEDTLNIRPLYSGRIYMFNAGFILIWFAALLTAITGWDYVVKSRPYFSDNAE